MSGDSQAFQNAMNNGHSAAWEQSWDQAARYYRQALEEAPQDAVALTSLGLALYELRDYPAALQCYQQAAKITPEDPLPMEKQSQIHEQMGNPAKAVEAGLQAAELRLKGRDVEKSISGWKSVLSIDPENRTARTRLAMVLEKLGRSKEAVSEYLALASILQRSNEAEKARQLVQYCFQLVPGSTDAQQALSFLKTGQLLPKPTRTREAGARAAQNAKPVESLPPGQILLDPIAETLQTAMVQLADALFEQADDVPATVRDGGRRGLTAISHGSGSGSGDPTRIRLHLGQAIDSQTRREFSQAAAELERAVEIGFNRPAAMFDLGYLLSEKDAQKATGYLQRSARNPDFALGSHLLLAKIQYQAGALSAAASHYLQSLGLADAATVAPDQAESLRQLYEPIVEMQSRQNDPEHLKTLCDTIASQLMRADWRQFLTTARAQLPAHAAGTPLPLAEMLLESRSGHVIEAQATVKALAARGMLRSAMEEAFYALQYAPTYLPLHIQIAELLLHDGQIQAAIDKYLLVSDLYSLRGESAQAVDLLTRVADIAPMDLSVRNKLINLLVDRGRMDEAISQYMQVAEVYYRMADLETARQTYQSALRLTQGASSRAAAEEILFRIADIDMQRIDYRAAVRTYEQLRTLKPEDAVIRSSLIQLQFRLKQDANALAELDGYLSLLENSKRRPDAIFFLAELLAEYPDKMELRRRLADLYRMDNQIEKAVEQLDAISDALIAAGSVPAARKMLEAIVNLNPPNVEEYRTTLRRMGGTGRIGS